LGDNRPVIRKTFLRWASLLLLSGCGASGQYGATSADDSSSTPPAWDRAADKSLRLPSGEACYAWLDRLGIRHERTKRIRGVHDPVRITGPIGGISYSSEAQPGGVVCDCRLALALDWSSRTLAPMGVTAIRYSGAYVNRTTRSGKPSMHAKGLAIDVHGITFGKQTHWVAKEFEHGLGDGCEEDAPELNHVACRLRELRLFRELITPDHNWDHHDHLHLGIAAEKK
jgi:hypothetical protein